MKKLLLITFAILFSTQIFAQARSNTSTEAHQSQVNKISCIGKASSEDVYYTAGEDGFIIRWDGSNEGEHFQISDVGIKLLAVAPNGNDIAVYESDGGSVNKVSIWDWKNLQRKKQIKFTDSITSLAFSAKGTYLIIGTATVDGAVFIKTGTWTEVSKIKANTSIVNYINTSDSEKTCAFYSPSGTLSYYNLLTGELKQKFSIIQGLNQTTMFNKNIFLAGVKDNCIYIINAFTGSSIASIPAQNPILLSNTSDYNLYYLEYDGRNTYELKMLESTEELKVSNPRIVKTLKGPRGSSAINVGSKTFTNVYFGGLNGSIYKTSTEPNTTTENMEEVTQHIYTKINSMTAQDNVFYFLTEDSIFSSSYDSGIVSKIAENTKGENELITYGEDNFILWSKDSRNTVLLLNKITKENTELFTPKSSLQNLRYSRINDKDYLLDVESNSSVNIYEFESNKLREIYSGTGVQDAVLAKNGNVYIAKSAATNPKVPLLQVNPETLETVPLRVSGNVCYGLCTDGTTIYGINLISDETGRATYTFSFNTSTNTYKNILRFTDEDSGAFTYLNGNNLYTNIGKNKLYNYNLTTKKNLSYNRTASMPKSVFQQGNRVVILNDNGSLSWCGTASSQILYDWYLKTDGNWYEY